MPFTIAALFVLFEEHTIERIDSRIASAGIAHLRMIADAAFHRPAGVVMLHAEADERRQAAVVFGDGAFHLRGTTRNP